MTAVTHLAIVIERRFHGPPRSGRGGYTCGPLGRELQRAVQVSPCSPPQLDRQLTIERDDDDERLLLRVGATILADAQSTTPELDPPPHVELAAAQAASSRRRGFAHHPFPTRFRCGPNRGEG